MFENIESSTLEEIAEEITSNYDFRNFLTVYKEDKNKRLNECDFFDKNNINIKVEFLTKSVISLKVYYSTYENGRFSDMEFFRVDAVFPNKKTIKYFYKVALSMHQIFFEWMEEEEKE